MPVIGPEDYNTVVDLIADVYNTQPANITSMLESYGANNAYDAYRMLENTPYEILYTLDNNVGAYTYKATGSTIINSAAGEVNSNLQTIAKTDVTLPISTTYADPTSPVSGPAYEVGPRTAPASSIGSTIMGVLDKVALGVMGVSIGAKLGAYIDQAIYDFAPSFWDEVAPTINPATWSTIATTDGGQSFINTIFGIDGNKTTPYVPTDAVAYFALLMQQQGFFSSGGYEPTPEQTQDLFYNEYYSFPLSTCDFSLIREPDRHGNIFTYVPSAPVYGICFMNVNSSYGTTRIDCYAIYNAPFTLDRYSNGVYNVTQNSGSATSHGLTYYYYQITVNTTRTGYFVPSYNIFTKPSNIINSYVAWDSGFIIYNGQSTGPVPGVSIQPGATLPNLTNDDTPATADQKLRNLYPDWYRNPIYLPSQQPDGSIKDVPYIPMPFVPNPDMKDNPTNNPENDDYIDQNTDPTVDPETSPDSLIETIFRYLNPNPPDTIPPDPDTGDGTGPTVIIPEGNASSLWSVYNPTQGQVNAFGAWLWSSNFIDQIAKLFLQPMDAIVGIHKVFAPPIISGSSTIHCGYLDSGVPSAIVGNQYTYVDCGTVNLYEHFGNVFDYSPYTTVRIYLPFIGIVPIDVGDVMRASINVRYGVDVITGACLAMVKVTRDGNSGGVLYQYGGSCIVRYPHSSGSYMGVVGGVLGLAASALSIASGVGGVAGALGAVKSLGNMHTDTQVSGSFSGESGAMGAKIPYLIVSRPQPKVADGVNTFLGYPANYSATLRGVSGFIKVKSCHVWTVSNATENEKDEIEKHLKAGIVIL